MLMRESELFCIDGPTIVRWDVLVSTYSGEQHQVYAESDHPRLSDPHLWEFLRKTAAAVIDRRVTALGSVATLTKQLCVHDTIPQRFVEVDL